MDIKKAVKEDDVEYILLNLETNQEYCLTDNPLLLAIKYNKEDIIRFLFEEKYHLACSTLIQEEILYLLCKKGHNEYLMKALYEITYNQQQLNKALGKSAIGGDTMTVQILLNAGATFNQNSTLIEDAFAQNNEQVALNLLSFVDDLLYRDQNGDTYLHHAAYSGCKPILLQYLLFRGIDVNVQNNFGHTPMMLSILGVELNGEVDFFKTAHNLAQAGADVNLQDQEGFTVLMYVCQFENYSMYGEKYILNFIHYLISIGADITLANNYGETALDIAQKLGFTSAAEVIKEHLNPSISFLYMRDFNGEKETRWKYMKDTSFLSENGYSIKMNRLERWKLLENQILKQYSIQEVIDKLSCLIYRFKTNRKGNSQYRYCISEWEYDVEQLIAFRKKCIFHNNEE